MDNFTTSIARNDYTLSDVERATIRSGLYNRMGVALSRVSILEVRVIDLFCEASIKLTGGDTVAAKEYKHVAQLKRCYEIFLSELTLAKKQKDFVKGAIAVLDAMSEHIKPWRNALAHGFFVGGGSEFEGDSNVELWHRGKNVGTNVDVATLPQSIIQTDRLLKQTELINQCVSMLFETLDSDFHNKRPGFYNNINAVKKLSNFSSLSAN